MKNFIRCTMFYYIFNESYDTYIWFYFDCDVSDCSIGRFKTDDSEEEIIESVRNWLRSCEKPDNDFIEDIDNGILEWTELSISALHK